MKNSVQKILMNIMMAFMFIMIFSFALTPLTANAAPKAHKAHTGFDKNGSKHEGWTAISNEEQLSNFVKDGGSGYLTADIKLKDGSVYIDKEINLCLNGHSITQTVNEKMVFFINSGKLNLFDEDGNTGKITHTAGCAGTGVSIIIGEFEMNGGSISENTFIASAVDVTYGKFTMNGGIIRNNYTPDGGSSTVFVCGSLFIMNDGEILNNSADGDGAGIYLTNKSNFIMYGGNISKNSSWNGNGGGIYSNDSSLYIKDGTIEENYANYGGGLYVCDESALTIDGGTIAYNVAKNEGGGIFAKESRVEINDVLIKANSSYEFGGGIFASGAGGSLTINGGNVTMNQATDAGGGLYGESTNIVMNDGTFTGNSALYCGGWAISTEDNTTTFSILGGKICGNIAQDSVSAIGVDGCGLIVDSSVEGDIECGSTTHKIHYIPNQGKEGSYTQYYLQDYEESFVKNRFTRSGFTFYKWNTEPDGSGDSYGNEALIGFSDDKTLYAQWKPTKYSVVFEANGGSGTMATQSIKYNTSTALTKNAFTRQGYEFTGWNTKANGKGTSYADGAKVKLNDLNTNKITLYAQWKAETNIPYTVEHYKQKLDGTYAKKATATETFKGKTDAKVTPAVKTYTGFTSPEVKTEKIKGDGSLVVKYYYTRNSYKLKWDFAGGSAKGEYTSGSVKYGATITAPVPTRAGYTFNGWKTEVPEKMPANDVTIKATWKAKSNIKYTVEHYKQKVDGTYPATANESESFKGKTNASVTPEVKTYKGFTSPEVQTAKIKGDGTLVIKYYYTRNSYKLTWDFAGGTAKGSYTKGNVKYGEKITAPVPTRDGYEFTGWDKTVATKMPANDLSYKATWKKLSKEEQVRKFVERFYTIILERPAEAAGLADWTNRLISKTATGADVAAGFINSEEFQKKKMTDEEYVTKLYRAFFDREPDKGGYDGWLRELKNGKSRDEVLRGFIGSPEFNDLCKKYGINTGSY